MVKTVAEIYTSQRAYILAGILKSALWALTIFLVWVFVTLDKTPFNGNYRLTYFTLIGGFLFGVGAATNGGCAFSTLGHLANGSIWMLTAIMGFSLGIAGMSLIFPPVFVRSQTSIFANAPACLLTILLILLGVPSLREPIEQASVRHYHPVSG